MRGRRWTDAELEYLQAEYPRRTARQIATHLGRSESGVRLRAANMGLRKTRCRRAAWRREMADWLPEQVAAGLLDTEIAERWNAAGKFQVDRRTVTYYRHTLGIGPSDEVALRRRQVKRLGYRRQMERLHCHSLGDVFRHYRRRNAAASGWPLDCSPFECRILDLLSNGKHWTRRELVAAIGGPPAADRYNSHRALTTSRGCGSVLGNLVRRGLVVKSSGRPVRGAGKGRSQFTYRLSRRAAEHHARCTRRRFVG